RAALLARQDTDGVHFNIAGGRNTTPGTPVPTPVQNGGGSAQFAVNHTYLVIGAYTLDPASADVANLWVYDAQPTNPDPNPPTFSPPAYDATIFGAAAAPAPQVTDSSGNAVTTRRLDSLMIRRNAPGPVEVDEFR